PIHHLELWLDGELAQTYYNSDLSEPAPIQIGFNQTLTAGSHLLIVRAVDSFSLIGQSLPVTAQGSLAFTGEGPFSLVSIPPDGSLDETLAASGTDLNAVLLNNPGLGAGASPGTVIAIPIPKEVPAPGPNPPAPPSNPTFLDLIKLLPIGNPPLALIPVQVAGPPSPPAGLQARGDACSLNLTWQDTSEDEAGFQVWITGLGVKPRVAARTAANKGTGPVSLELPAVGAGDFVYWVEAYNVAGAQPSNQVFVSVPGPCPNQLTSTLTVETLDFNSSAVIEKGYCYISLQDHPEVRLPVNQDQFIPLSGGKGDLTSLPASSRNYKMAVPNSGSIKIQGECWGWTGGTLSKLGVFNQTVQETEWNGSRIPISSAVFDIGLALTVSLPEGKLVPFAAPDPGIPSPILLKLEAPIILGDVGLDPMDALNYLDQGNLRTLTWEWLPSPISPAKLTGYTILINGIPFQHVTSPAARSAVLKLPGFCGTNIKVSLVAEEDDRQSLPSNILVDVQPPCGLYAVVDFKGVHFGWTNDSLNPSNECDNLQAYFRISVSEVFDYYQPEERQGVKVVKSFNGGGYYRDVRCGIYDLNYVAGSRYTETELDPTRIILPLRAVEGHPTHYVIEAAMWDYDVGSGDDLIARFDSSFVIGPAKVESLLADMQGSPPMIKDWYCDEYIGIFNGDAKSKIDVCVDLYATDPSTGAVTLPSNAPIPDPSSAPPLDSPGLQFKPVSDIAILETYINGDGNLFARIINEGPDDLVKKNLTITTSIQTNDPNLYGLPWTSRHFVNLKVGSKEDLSANQQKLDPSLYDYTITVAVSLDEGSEPGLNNNQRTDEYTAGGLEVVPNPLVLDLQIADIRSNSAGKLVVEVHNNGPDFYETAQSTINCEVTQVSRLDGTSTTISGIEEVTYHNLNAGDSKLFSPAKSGLEFNLSANWFIISCQIQSDGVFADPDPANNFLTKNVY
ncbi:MAG: hypothetical protein MUP11_08590, partial [Anaerolineales bacterium]|nr:hypothetical protein [Anaerolineales bacterium]